MEQFIVSARKYRPTNFESLIGQENISTTLKNSITRGQLAHAYLFCGPRGVGKTSAARIFAKTINCLNPSQGLEPCGECESCLSFDQGRSYNIYELDAASNNSVEDIRTLTDKVRIPPQIGKYCVYIIDEVHMLSTSAFNAFLKTLEEPPRHAVFILATTEKHKILPTILSRCQTFDFNRITIEGIVRNLTQIAEKEGISISQEALHIIARKADGAMRDALTLFDQTVAFCGTNISYEDVVKNLNVLDYDYYFSLTENFLSGDFTSALMTFDTILTKGFNSLHFISGLSSHFRDLIVCKNATSRVLAELAPSIAQKYQQMATTCSLPFLYEALSITTSCEAAYKSSGNVRLLIEFALMKLSNIATNVFMGETRQEATTPVRAIPTPQPHQATTTTQSTPQNSTQEREVAPEQPVKREGPAEIKISSESPVAEKATTKETPVTTPEKVETKSASKEDENPIEFKPFEFSFGDESKPEKSPDKIPATPVVETPKPKRKGLSIKDILGQSSANQQEQGSVEDVVNQEVTKTSQADLQKSWDKIAAAETAQRFAITLSSSSPEIQEDGCTVVFKVKNILQKDWIEKNRSIKMENFLREDLNNQHIKLHIEIIPEKEKERSTPYMPIEKAKILLQSYPELMELQKEIDLDVK